MYKIGTKISISAFLFIVIIGIFFTAVFSPFSTEKPRKSAENTYNTNCGSCHLVPDPTKIPKSIWENSVLPEMAARMGYGNSTKSSYPSPEIPMIDSTEWNQIEHYILSLAPDSIPNVPSRKGRTEELSQFKSSLQTLGNPNIAGAITNIQYDTVSGYLFTANVYGQVREWRNRFSITKYFDSPVVSTILKKDTLYLTEIGIMKPSEDARGAIYAMHQGKVTSLFTKLHRPVYTEISDLNEDGKNEIIICEFGNYTGELSMLVKSFCVLEPLYHSLNSIICSIIADQPDSYL
ncbi:hypothetical protein LCGC14_2946310 [marine sediment metagenome]|uniref:Cytochrome c domain-containing protein n=1 Tax=marine sediment metagenome TaxID=412755 RepID=A0A0F8ZP92_9ZZZZ